MHNQHGQRIYGLDILRSIAILLVIYDHSFRFFDVEYFGLADGVSIFFVLSGFLIGHILLKKIDNTDFGFRDVIDFWLRRWLRTIPAYFFVLTILVVASIYGGSKLGWFDYARFYLFIQNFFFGRRELYKEAWSLSIEEWFYLITPILFFISFRISKKERQKIVLFWIIAIIAGETIFRNYKIFAHNYKDYRQWGLYAAGVVTTRLDSIMYGVLGAWLAYNNHRIWQYKNLMFNCGCGMFVFIVVEFHKLEFTSLFVYWQLTLESIASLLVIPKLSSLKDGKGALFRFFTFTSLISYSMYLLNFTPFYLLTNDLPIDKHVLFWMNLAWDFGASYLLYRLIEKPFMQLRERIPVFGTGRKKASEEKV